MVDSSPESIAKGLQARPLEAEAIRLLTEQTAEVAADRAAKKTVEYAFLLLGVNIQNQAAVEKLKDDLGFLARTNRGAKVVKSTTIKTCVGAVAAGFIALVIAGFKDTIFAWFK